MKGLKTLIRLQQRELDLLRRELVKLEEMRDGYIQRVELLSEELKREIEVSGDIADMRGFFGDFSETIKQKQKELAQRILNMETQIQKQTIEISKQFADLKKYEIAYERFLEREKKAKAKKEQDELDEIGTQLYMRKEDECV